MSDVRQAVYNEALHWGLIEPMLTGHEKRFFDDAPGPLVTMTDTELMDLAYDSKTAARREHSFGEYTPDENWVDGQVVELARLVIPSGNLGIIRRIDTLVVDSTTGQAISPWNNPVSWDNVFQYFVTFNRQDDPSVRERLVRIPPIPPGPGWNLLWQLRSTPLYPLLSWQDDRYAWGNPSNEMGVAVPKDIFVRLMVVCRDDTEFTHTVKGRLVATIQLESSISAAWQARRGNAK